MGAHGHEDGKNRHWGLQNGEGGKVTRVQKLLAAVLITRAMGQSYPKPQHHTTHLYYKPARVPPESKKFKKKIKEI